MEVIETLTVPAYSVAETSRLVRMNNWTVQRYLHGYSYDYSYPQGKRKTVQPPVVKRESGKTDAYASFLDLIDLLFVKEFLDRGYGLPTIRKSLDEVRDRIGAAHFAQSVFFTKGKKQIIWQESERSELIALLTGGQVAIAEFIISLSDRLEFEDVTKWGFAKRWFPDQTNDLIVVDPEYAFGRPTVRGIPTHNIYDMFLGEGEKLEPVSNWFQIPVREVKAAVQFEQTLWG